MVRKNPPGQYILNDCAGFKLANHAVIEASAGTGKTYTVIELVLRLLTEEMLPLSQILLVTFTEKATAELRQRIKQRIDDAILETAQQQVKQHLLRCRQQIAQAAIFTLHGFCHGVMREFAFEQGATFTTEVVDDLALATRLLLKLKRRWLSDEQIAGDWKRYQQQVKTPLDRLLLELLSAHAANDLIEPNIEDLKNQAQTAWSRLKQLDVETLQTQFIQLQGSTPNTISKRCQEKFLPLLSNLQNLTKHSADNETTTLPDQTAFAKLTANKDILAYLFFRIPKVYQDYADKNCLNSPQLFDFFDDYRQLTEYYNNRKFSIIQPLLIQLQAALQDHKNNHGLISYNDMINCVWQQLQQEADKQSEQQRLTNALRQRYRVAIIDEFQDTDINQWLIFQHLFANPNCQADAPKSHRLWLVGDPKQAIYGFRGADLPTYYRAVEYLIEQQHSDFYRLNTNYRTTEQLLSQLNDFFSTTDEAAWFYSGSVCVNAPQNHAAPPLLLNHQDLAPIQRVRVEQFSNIDQLRHQLAEQFAAIINNLHGNLSFQLKGQARLLDFSDVCVLVRSASDAEPLEQAFQAANIPYAYYKKKGLFESEEALHYQVLLTAFAYPKQTKRLNNALLTCFFALQAQQLAAFADEQLPRLNALWLQLKEAAEKRQWIEFFEILLHDCGTLQRAKSSRQITNLQQIKQLLLPTALQQNLSPKELLSLLLEQTQKSINEQSLHNKDSERAAVQIMTMHTAKGLEFPVVLLFGGFAAGRNQDLFYRYYDELRQQNIIDLSKAQKKPFEQQQIEEAKRLYYVAMTRAILLLFLPDYTMSSRTNGHYSELLLNRLQLMNVPTWQALPIATTTQPAAAIAGDSLSQQPQIPNALQLKQRTRRLFSFSSLNKHNHPTDTIGEQPQLNSQLPSTPLNHNQEIPGGVVTGNILHGILERVSFAQVGRHNDLQSLWQDSEIMSLVDWQMQFFQMKNQVLSEGNHRAKDYRQLFAAWVWHSLNKPLTALNGDKLANIPSQQRRHELSFYWNRQQINLSGFIDLLFGVQNGDQLDYFILDWKSNFSPQGYAPQVLQQQLMKAHNYKQQYQLYALAMQRWFDVIKPQNARLAGAIYLFSRGINCQEKSEDGVFFDDFSVKSWQFSEVEQDLITMTEAKT